MAFKCPGLGWGSLRHLYPSIDLEIISSSGQWMWRLVTHGSDAAKLAAVRLRVDGAQGIGLEKSGQALDIMTAVDNIALPLLSVGDLPGVLQTGPSTDNNDVIAPFAAASTNSDYANPSDHNPNIPVVAGADISQLLYSTFLGGNNWTKGMSIAVDGTGAAYVTGSSDSTDFTYTVGYTQTNMGNADVFVAKLAPNGNDLVYLTFLGQQEDDGNGVAVDANGAAYVGGRTLSSNFPTVNAFQNASNVTAPFIAKLDSTGTQLVYSSYFGGGAGHSVAVRPGLNDLVYMTGQVERSGPYTTTANAFQTGFQGGLYDGFVAEIDTTRSGTSSLIYSSYLGGTYNDCEQPGVFRECSIAVDKDGLVYIAGPTTSGYVVPLDHPFPTTASAYSRSCGGSL